VLGRIALKAQGGSIQVAEGKSRAARRALPIVPAVYTALAGRHAEQNGPSEGWVFPSTSKCGHFEGGSAKNQHEKALRDAKLNDKALKPFVPYVLRHMALTRLAEANCAPLLWRGSRGTAA
jgi:integrase